MLKSSDKIFVMFCARYLDNQISIDQPSNKIFKVSLKKIYVK